MSDNDSLIRSELMDIDHLPGEEDYEPADIKIQESDEDRGKRTIDNGV